MFFYVAQNKQGSQYVGFFDGYDILTVGIIICNSFVGIVITFVYKYADAIVKTFASACVTSILLFINAMFFSQKPNLVTILACGIVFLAICIFEFCFILFL